MRVSPWLRWSLVACLFLVGATDLLAVNDHKSEYLHNATATTASSSALNGTALDTTGYTSLGLQVVISDTATVNFEGTVDNSNWVATGCVATSDTATATVTSTTASKLYQCNVAGLAQFRARISGFTAGTVTVKGRLTTGPWSKRGGTGDALTTNPLSQFAATTSAQLAGVISNETGSGLLVFGTSPTFSGVMIIPDGSQTAPSIGFAGAGNDNTGLYRDAADILGLSVDGIRRAFLSTAQVRFFDSSIGNNELVMSNSGQVTWAADATSIDIRLVRDAAATLAQRNGANAQVFNIYNTFTDASNYEMGGFQWSGNVLYLRTAAAGSGTVRNLVYDAAAHVFLDTALEIARLDTGLFQPSYAAADAASFALTFRKARGTVASPTVITTGDDGGVLNFDFYVGATNTYQRGAYIFGDSGGTISDSPTGVGGLIDLYTAIVGAEPALRVRIDNVGHVAYSGTAPTMGACGTSPSVVGNDMVMEITVGTGGIATSCAITFAQTWLTNAPVCVAESDTDIVAIKSVETTTTATFTVVAAFTASSKLEVVCFGRV